MEETTNKVNEGLVGRFKITGLPDVSEALTNLKTSIENVTIETKKTVEETTNVTISDKGISIHDEKPDFPITISFTIKGIYGKCKYEFNLRSEFCEYNTAHMLMSKFAEPYQPYDLHVDEIKNKLIKNEKYSYSCTTINSETRNVLPGLTKKNLPGLPSWLSEDEYYRMCKLQNKH